PSTLKRVAAAPARPDPPPQWRHALAPWRPYLYSLGIESRQRAVYALEQVDQLLALALAQGGQRLTARLLRDPPYALDDRLGRLAQKQTVGTTIDRVRPTFYPTVLLHAVEASHQRHGICFQTEDGIRHWSVTGVQTCALPIWSSSSAGMWAKSKVPPKPFTGTPSIST